MAKAPGVKMEMAVGRELGYFPDALGGVCTSSENAIAWIGRSISGSSTPES